MLHISSSLCLGLSFPPDDIFSSVGASARSGPTVIRPLFQVPSNCFSPHHMQAVPHVAQCFSREGIAESSTDRQGLARTRNIQRLSRQIMSGVAVRNIVGLPHLRT